jgi:anti-sigma-K factor RskA
MTTDIHALVGAYALDAIDDIERAAFDRHVADCASCRSEVDELRETVGRLADSTWSVPPPRLRTDVMAAIGRTRQVPPATTAGPELHARAAVSRWRRYTAGAAAAGILAAGAGAATWAVQEQRVRQERDVATIAQRDQARTESILSAPDVVFRTAPMIGGGKVTVASSQLRNAGVALIGAGRAPASDQVLQLWTIRGQGAPVSAGTLDSGQASGTKVVDGLPGTDVFAVSLEPAGGSAKPTEGAILAQVPLI